MNGVYATFLWISEFLGVMPEVLIISVMSGR